MNPDVPGLNNDTQLPWDFLGLYDPTVPVAYWHQNLLMALICFLNGSSFLIMCVRMYLRVVRLGRFHTEDKWMIPAAILLVFPYWVSQIAFTVWGGGLHVANVHYAWRGENWKWGFGFIGYFLVSSLIKVSITCCILRIVPLFYKKTRWALYALCVVICILGIVESCLWLMPCRPFLSNFVYNITSIESTCINIDPARYAWSGLSVVVDLILVFVPLKLVHSLQVIRKNERSTLYGIFAINVLGTLTCAFGIYGTYLDRWSLNDETYDLFAYMVCNDVEILMYTLCASVTVLAPLFTNSHSPDNTPIPLNKLGDSSTGSAPTSDSNPLSIAVSSNKNHGAQQSNISGWTFAMNDSNESIAQLNEQPGSSLTQTLEEFEMTMRTRPSDVESSPRSLSRYARQRASYDASLPSAVQNQMV